MGLLAGTGVLASLPFLTAQTKTPKSASQSASPAAVVERGVSQLLAFSNHLGLH